MSDTLALAQQLPGPELVGGDVVEIANRHTRLSTDIAGVRTELASLDTHLIREMVGTVIATAAVTVGVLRLLG